MTYQSGPQASVLVCNSVAMEVGTNNPVIIGVFDGLQSTVFPTRASFFAVAKVWGMGAGANNTCALQVVDPASDTVVSEAGEHKFATSGPQDVHTAISYFQNISIPKSGVYELRAVSGGKAIGAYPINVGSPTA